MTPETQPLDLQTCGRAHRQSERSPHRPARIDLLCGSAVRRPGALPFVHHVALNGDDGSDAFPSDICGMTKASSSNQLPTRCGPPLSQRRFPASSPLEGPSSNESGGDEMLFADGRSRNQPYLCMISEPAVSIGVRLKAVSSPKTAPPRRARRHARFWTDVTGPPHPSARWESSGRWRGAVRLKSCLGSSRTP